MPRKVIVKNTRSMPRTKSKTFVRGVMGNNIKLGKYKHFKGDVMEVVGIALDSETQEEFVIYKHVTGEKKGEKNYWIRKVPMFLEEIERDGKKIKRFTFME